MTGHVFPLAEFSFTLLSVLSSLPWEKAYSGKAVGEEEGGSLRIHTGLWFAVKVKIAKARRRLFP